MSDRYPLPLGRNYRTTAQYFIKECKLVLILNEKAKEMIPQHLSTRLMAILLCTVSTCGTLALFGSVPLIAQVVSSLDQSFNLAEVSADLANTPAVSKTPFTRRLEYLGR